ncbi:hypothetical protein EDC96DRAFT_150057 [Choanephora cucurbitarum]|nr:hypothetical protein EDC96DRAFT_150057 [Choanephora cucurbitarum]
MANIMLHEEIYKQVNLFLSKMNTTLQNYFNSYPLKEINLNSIDIYMKNKHIAITKHECHSILSQYLNEMRGPLGEQETSEVKRIKDELKHCNASEENIKIWSKKTNEEASGSKRKAKDDGESTRSKSRSSTSSKSVGIAPFLALLPPLDTQLNCSERWLLGDLDVSSELMKIKGMCIDKYNSDEKMRPIEQL